MTHLGTWVSALVDGQLPAADTERALAHVAACRACADEVAAARQARRALSVAGDVRPDPELTARLLALGATPPPAPRREAHRSVVPLGESAFAVPAKALSGDLMGRRRSPARVLAGATAGTGMLLATLFVLGEQAPVAPATHPAEALTALGRAPHEAPVPRGVAEQHLVTTLASTSRTGGGGATTAVGGRGTDAAVLRWMQREGWSHPDRLPPGYAVTAVRLTPAAEDDAAGDVLEVDLAGPHGRVVLVEQRGRLDVGSLGPTQRLALGDRTLHVLSLHPWHAVWQSGDTVVSMVSEAPHERALDLVEHFPAQAYDDGIPARLTRGWHTATGALATR